MLEAWQLTKLFLILLAAIVGIGTTTPDAMLSVWGNGKFFGTLSASSTAYLTDATISGNSTLTNASTTYLTVATTLFGGICLLAMPPPPA